VSAMSVSYGYDKPDNGQAYRVSATWMWASRWLATDHWYLTGYWDLGVGYYSNNGDRMGNNKDLYAVSLVPMFRWQRQPYANSVAPFVELGVGPALLSQTKLGKRGLGSSFQFDDRLGVGFRFGEKQRYELTVYYNHISNASIRQPNAGINRISLMFRYFF